MAFVFLLWVQMIVPFDVYWKWISPQVNWLMAISQKGFSFVTTMTPCLKKTEDYVNVYFVLQKTHFKL